MPQPKSISPGKGREALRQKVQIFRLNLWLNRTYYSLLKFTSKIFKNCLLQSNLQRITQNSLHPPQIFPNHLLIHCVSGTCLGREPSGIPVNYANSVQFAHTVRELREIRTFY